MLKKLILLSLCLSMVAVANAKEKFIDIHKSPRTEVEVRAGGFYNGNNWSGYHAMAKNVDPEGKIQAVGGSWIVPYPQKTKKDSYSSSFIGIDGFTCDSNDAFQIGTASNFVNKEPQTFPWIRIIIKSEKIDFFHPFTEFEVSAGDHMTASIYVNENKEFFLTLSNDTTQKGVVFFTPIVFENLELTTAEWVLATATDEEGNNLPLARFGKESFIGTALINRSVGPIGQFDFKPINIFNKRDKIIAKTSVLSPSGVEFSITRE